MRMMRAGRPPKNNLPWTINLSVAIMTPVPSTTLSRRANLWTARRHLSPLRIFPCLCIKSFKASLPNSAVAAARTRTLCLARALRVVQRAVAPPVLDIDIGAGGVSQQAHDFGMASGSRQA
jgi:hypothetical protein